MCGFVGILGEDDPERIRRMTNALAHRGPDGEGFFTDGGIALGHRRLAIIDIEGGAQPIASDDGRYVIVYNGEVYNHVELRRELERLGKTFRTRVDTEVILQGYIEYGPEVVHKLRGMFAFAIWDASERALFLARDHMGIKPLYYGVFDGRFYFASEMKAILADPRVPRRADLAGIDVFLTFLKFPVDLTPFEGIQQLEAGSWLMARDDGYTLTPYYDVAFPEAYDERCAEEEIVERTLAAAEETVRLRLMSDVPLGVFLSGGVDSSLVTALMARQMGEPVRTFSLVHKGESSWLDESEYIHRVVSELGTVHAEIESDPAWYEHIPHLIGCFDQPCTTSLNSYMISRLAARDVKVVLTGTGGDEAFAGYGRYRLADKLMLGAAVAESWAKMFLRRLHRRREPFVSLGSAFFDRKVYFSDLEKRSLYTREFLAAAGEGRPRQIFDRFFERKGLPDALSRCLYTDQKLYLISNLHNNLDKVSMAHGLEARVPLCDYRFLEFANGVPSSLKLKGGELKYVLKEAASRVLPREIIYREKRGFGIPLRTWVRGGFAAVMRRALTPEAVERRGLFSWPCIAQLMEDTFSGKADYSLKLWMLMVIELWFRMYIDSEAFRDPPAFEELTT